MSDTQIRVGRVIRERRKILGLNQGQVADIAGIDASSWSRIERGTQGWTPDVLDRIARALQVTPAELIAAADAPSEPPLPAPAAATDMHEDEREALAHLRRMSSSTRRAVYQLIAEVARSMR